MVEGSTSKAQNEKTTLTTISIDLKKGGKVEKGQSTDRKKLTVAVINFDGPALDWYRSQEERKAFKGWQDLKQKMLPVVLEQTFMNGLSPWLKLEVEMWEPVGLAQMTKLALKIENREMVQKECGLNSKATQRTPSARSTSATTASEGTTTSGWPMRTITLRKVATGDNR
ncbi:transposon Tf2-1 polyprotein isoform X1 [Cucumis melo var. makuwa]|uniref:Transposon Tf2-1 polyprotein isoform X1 n=1 Tax=Cucumis melo var. makuwa TaxID=1194695 RepID=A0A5A7V5D3_CUCMM|nr:transposon Tf2-1 polyprotein isoform X1 [Cucumis melo var. makuwa]